MIVVGTNVASAADTWVKTDPSSLATGDVVAIVDLTTAMAMNNSGGTSSAPAATAVTLNSDQSEITSEVPASLQWELTVANGSYKFGVSGTENYLYCTNTNNGVRVGTNGNNSFVMKQADANNEEDYLYNSATSRYLGCYNEQDWRCYPTVNNNIKDTRIAFYKKVAGQETDAELDHLEFEGDYPTLFAVDDEFSYEGLVINAVYDDGTSKDVTSKATYSLEKGMDYEGTQMVEWEYTEGDVKVGRNYQITTVKMRLSKIEATTTKNTFFVGEEFTTEGLTVMATYVDERVVLTDKLEDREIDVTDKITVVTAPDMSTAGTFKEVKVSYTDGDRTQTAFYYINVEEAPEGATATGNLNNSDTGVFKGVGGFTSGAHSVSGTLATSAGNVIIDYSGSPNAYLNDTHIRMYASGSSLKFTAPDGYELTKIVFTITSGNNSNLDADKGTYSEGTWTGAESDVTFTGKNGTIRISTAEVTLEKATPKSPLVSIAVEGPNTEFAIGDEFDFGGTVTATYENGNTKDVTAQAEFTGYDMSQAGEQTVTVSYTEGDVTKTTTYDITVNAVAVTGISLDIIEATLVVGQKKKITATIEPDNATVNLIWTSEDESVATVDQDGEVTAVGVGTIIVKAAAENDNDIFGACTINVVELETETYSLVTNVSDLAEGDEVIIVNTEKAKAMSSTQNTNNRAAEDVEFDTSGKAIVPNTGEIQVFTLEGDAEGWYFNTGNGYIYAASNSSNHLKTETEKNDNAKAVITITDDGTSVVFQRPNGRNVLQYNSGSDIFSCYESATQSPVQIYKKGDATSATTYTLVADIEGTETEYPFTELTLTQELPAWTYFYIKDSKGKKYYAEDGTHYVIVAENHENLNTSENDEYMFSFRKANTWVFTITEPTDAEGLKLTVNPETPAGTKYMMADDFDPSGTFQETEDVFDADGKLTKEMTTATFCIVKGDDYIYYSLGAAESNAEDGNGLSVWEFSGEDNTVGFMEGELSVRYRVNKAGTYNFTLDLENNTITALPSVRKYTLVTKDGDEIVFDSELKITEQAIPAQTEFYIKDNFGKTYYGGADNYFISAENHENLDTYYPVEDETPLNFYLMKENTWNFSVTEPTDADGTIKLTVNPVTVGETKYMLADVSLHTSDFVFDENHQLTKAFTAGEAFYITRSDDYGLFDLTAADRNDPDGYYVWEFSEDASNVAFIPGKSINAYRMKEAGTYTITLYLENRFVSVEKVPTTYTLMANEGDHWAEYEFDGLKLNEEFPNGTEFYIKDNEDHIFYGQYNNSVIYAENHENLSTYYPIEDPNVTEKPSTFELKKDAVWHFTITEPTEADGTIKLTVVPSTIEDETKYMLSSRYLGGNDEVFDATFDENGKVTKQLTAGEAFYISREDGFGLFNLTAAEKNNPEGYYVWEFSEDAPTVGYIPAKIINAFRVKDTDLYTITLDTENKTVTVEAVPNTYTLVAGETEYEFNGLTLTQEIPAQTEFYIKDNKGNEYHSADAQTELIIIAENHENLPTSAGGKDFYLKKANTWVFTLTEASDGLLLTVSPETEGETKYMLSGYLQESDDVFDENLQLTKEMTSTTEEFYFTRSDDYGLTNLTPATFNAPEDRRYWIFSEDDPTVEFIAGEIRGSYTVGEAGTYTFTLDLTNNTVTAEKTVEYVDLTITHYEWATFVTPSAVLFPDDVTAYIITETNGGKAYAEQIVEAPAGTPVIVNGTEGIHKLLKVENAVLDYMNMLQVSDGTVTGDGTIYVLAVEEGQPGFARLSNGKKLSEGKAYLKVESAGAKVNLVIDGEATDIRGIAVDFTDGDWYNLQGVKVTNPQRGIYIHNGKKVVVK